MAIETLPEPSIPITTPFRPRLGFLTATPIIATATIFLVLIIAMAILAPWLSPRRAVAHYLWRTDFAADRPWLRRVLGQHRPCHRSRLRLLQMGRRRDD